VRASRALGYELHAGSRPDLAESQVGLTFRNTGRLGAVFHVYRLPQGASETDSSIEPVPADPGQTPPLEYGSAK
jgi:phospholipase C